jgi:hypothetical protein
MIRYIKNEADVSTEIVVDTPKELADVLFMLEMIYPLVDMVEKNEVTDEQFIKAMTLLKSVMEVKTEL